MKLTKKSARVLETLANLTEAKGGAGTYELAGMLFEPAAADRGHARNGKAGATGRVLSLFASAGWVEGGHGETWRVNDAGRQALAAFQQRQGGRTG